MLISFTQGHDHPELPRVRRAMVVVDIVESVRLMLAQEDEVIRRWRLFVDEVRSEVLPVHGGKWIKSTGDGMLWAFDNASSAVAAAFDAQARMAVANRAAPHVEALLLRMGIHVAEVVETDYDLLGTGVNLAARLASLGNPGDVIGSMAVRDAVVARLDAQIDDLGECYLKHIEQPCRAFRLRPMGTGQPVRLAAPRPLIPRLTMLPLRGGDAATVAPECLRVLTDDLVAALARRPQLQVVSRLSVQALGGRALDSGVLDLLLSTDYCASGVLGVRHGRLLLDLELTERGAPVWAGHFEGRVDSMLDAEGSLAVQAADAMCQAIFRRQMQQLHAAALPNLPGYTLLLQAMSLLHHLSRDDVVRAHGILEALSERHPRAPDVQAWQAKWHFLQIAQSWTDDRTAAVGAARQCLARALDVDPAHGLALAIQGHLHAFEDRSPVMAQAHLTEATCLAPNEPLAWLFLANVQAMLGDSDDALQSLGRAQGLSPFDPLAYLVELIASIVHSAAGHSEAALEHAQQSVAHNVLHLSSQIQLLLAQADAGDLDAARRTAARYLKLRPGASVQRFIDHHFAIDTPLARRQVAALLEAGIPL